MSRQRIRYVRSSKARLKSARLAARSGRRSARSVSSVAALAKSAAAIEEHADQGRDAQSGCAHAGRVRSRSTCSTLLATRAYSCARWRRAFSPFRITVTRRPGGHRSGNLNPIDTRVHRSDTPRGRTQPRRPATAVGACRGNRSDETVEADEEHFEESEFPAASPNNEMKAA